MKFNEKAQQVIEYLLIVVAVVGAVMGAAVPFKNATERSLNRAIATIYESYTWRLGDPKSCTSADGTILTCGSGTASRDVWCQRDDDRTKVADAYCEAQAGARPSEKVSCDMGPCGMTYHWVGLGYGPCNAPCGGGTQTQSVECRNSGGGLEPDSSCASAGPKPVSRACNETPCYGWVAGGSCIGLCSASCGIGRCEQKVTCWSNLAGAEETDQSKCTGLKPPTEISCNTSSSCGYQWIASGWGACETATAGCGPGKKYQTVRCVRASDKSEVDPENCAGSPKPHASADCHLGGCYNWYLTGGWGKCSRVCNTYDLIGTQNAIVECRDRKENKVDDSKCADVVPKPGMIRDCRGLPLCEFSWGNGEWDVCSNNCGEGIQTRDVWCTNVTEGKNYDLKYCLYYKPPERPATQTCTGNCYKWGATDWGACSTSCGAGTKTRSIFCKSSGGTGAEVDKSNCISSRGTGAAGPAPATSDDCRDTSLCCPNKICDYLFGGVYSENCAFCPADCPGLCKGNGVCENGALIPVGGKEDCTNSPVDCQVWSATVGLCGVNAGCPDGTRLHYGSCYNECQPDGTCVFTCGTLSTNATACSGTEATGLSANGSWSYSGCGGLGKCRAYCNAGSHSVGTACVPNCGDGICNYADTYSTCPSDCPRYSGCGCGLCYFGSSCSAPDKDGDWGCWCNLPPGYNWGESCSYAYLYGAWWTGAPHCFGTHVGDLCWEMDPPGDNSCATKNCGNGRCDIAEECTLCSGDCYPTVSGFGCDACPFSYIDLGGSVYCFKSFWGEIGAQCGTSTVIYDPERGWVTVIDGISWTMTINASWGLCP